MDDFSKKLAFGNRFCVYPFLHHHLTTSKEKTLCCGTDRAIEQDPGFNTQRYKEIRQAMLDNVDVDLCHRCYANEDLGKISMRQAGIKDMKPHRSLIQDQINKHLAGENLEPYWYDLRISNNCNLRCQMCGSLSSSSIAKEKGIENSYLSFEPDLEINPQSIKIYLAGGEPFLIKKFANILNAVTNLDCEIVVNTNGTVTNKSLINALSRFKNVNMTVSIDGYAALNSYIRRDSNWVDIDKNISKFQELGFSLHVNTVVQKDNINHLLELGKYLIDKGISNWSFIEVMDADHLTWDKVDDLDQDQIESLKNLPIVQNKIDSVNLLNSIIKRWQKKT